MKNKKMKNKKIKNKMRDDILQLFRPLDFLKVKNTSRGLYQIFLPICFAVIIFFLQTYRQDNFDILDDDAFIAEMISILQILVPFTIAALAAVATFPSDVMEKKLFGNPPPTLTRKVRGDFDDEELTRRRYVCLLFGYLTILGIALLLIGIILPDIIRLLIIVSIFSQDIVSYVALAIFAFMTGNFLSNILRGLFYLSDRIHRER